jgi:hypothetical protein
VLGLNFVQLAKNTRNHSGVGNCPYTLQYGQRCRHGCAALPIDKALLSTLHTEDDLMDVLQSINFVTDEARHETDADNHIEPQEAPQGTKADCIETEADCIEPCHETDAEHSSIEPQEAPQPTEADCIEPQLIETDAEHNRIEPQEEEALQPNEADRIEPQLIETDNDQAAVDDMESDEDDMDLANLLSSPNEHSNEIHPHTTMTLQVMVICKCWLP